MEGLNGTTNGISDKTPSGLKNVKLVQDVSVFKSVSKLKEEKAILEAKLRDVESRLGKSFEQKQDFQALNEQLKAWSSRIQAANRNNQGVPYVRDIKEICNKILNEMRKGEFKKITEETLTLDVQCFRQVHDGIKNLEKLCSKVLQNEANYKATWVEEMRQLIGRLIGSSNAILDLYFEE